MCIYLQAAMFINSFYVITQAHKTSLSKINFTLYLMAFIKFIVKLLHNDIFSVLNTYC